MGSPMCSFPTDLTLDRFNVSEGNYVAELIVPKLPLTQGLYRVALWADTRGECLDYIESTISFSVIDDDFFCKGKNVGESLSGKVVLCDHTWNIQK